MILVSSKQVTEDNKTVIDTGDTGTVRINPSTVMLMDFVYGFSLSPVSAVKKCPYLLSVGAFLMI